MKKERTSVGHFETCSVMLIASWALVVAGAAYGQTSPLPSPTPSSAAAEAAATDRDVGAAFREADRNSDGQLNREEARIMPAVMENFDAIDTDKDQLIGQDELTKAMQK